MADGLFRSAAPAIFELSNRRDREMVGALAAMAASALVQAMVGDGWEAIRHKVALIGQGQPDLAVERRLDAARSVLADAQPGELAWVRTRLAGQWETRLADFLADHPDAAG
jgi:hypothetical protein